MKIDWHKYLEDQAHHLKMVLFPPTIDVTITVEEYCHINQGTEEYFNRVQFYSEEMDRRIALVIPLINEKHDGGFEDAFKRMLIREDKDAGDDKMQG